jgi:hypothetical protein
VDKVRFQEGIGENHQEGGIDILPGQVEGVGLALWLPLPDEAGWEVIVGLYILFDLLAQVAHDEYILLHLQTLEPIEKVSQDRLASHREERLSLAVGMRPEARPQTSHGQHDFHLSPYNCGRILSHSVACS